MHHSNGVTAKQIPQKLLQLVNCLKYCFGTKIVYLSPGKKNMLHKKGQFAKSQTHVSSTVIVLFAIIVL